MKISKLMLSAFVAAAALVSCNKENHTPKVEGVKTVEINLGNMIMTKGLAGEPIKNATPVVVNDFQLFLTDASYSHLYHTGVKGDNDTEANFYWSVAENTLGSDFTAANYNYHYVPHHCNTIVAVANAGRRLSLEEAVNLTATIENQQDASNLLLFAEATLQSTDRFHESADKYAEVWVANPVLTPTVARFEVDGFVMNFNGSVYTSATVTDLAFQHYLPTMTYGTPGGSEVTYVNVQSDADVYSWFASINDDDTDATWYVDSFKDLTLEKPSAPTSGSNYVDKADIRDANGDISPRAYHFFAPAGVPEMFFKLAVDGPTGPTDAYLWTATYKYQNTANQVVSLTEIQPGTIYRMSAAGETEGDGSIPFDEDDLNTVDRCLEVTVEVHPWNVVLVTPEF